MNYLHTIKTQLVELVIPVGSTATRFYFNDQPFLRSKQIVSLETYAVNDIPASPTNIAVVDSDTLRAGFLTMYGNDPETPPVNPMSGQQANGAVVAQGEWIQNFPLISLRRVDTSAEPHVFMKETFIPRIWVWEKSYVTFPVGPAPETAVSILLNVGYIGVDTQVS